MFGLPQGSILGPLLFNVFSADLFLIHSDIDIANFADDNTPYLSAKNVDVISVLWVSFSISVQMVWKKSFKR